MEPNGLSKPENFAALLDYYKWVVNLATFVLVTSGSGMVFFWDNLRVPWLFFFGWGFLVLCIFANWLIVKRLITDIVIETVPEKEKNILHQIHEATGSLLKKYALVQNWSFLIGVSLSVLALIINWTLRP